MKKLLILSIAIFSMGLTAQVGINTPVIDASAALEITSTEGGILIPRMTETERDEIIAAADGLMIYQTDATAGFYYYNGTAWTALAGTGSDSWDHVATQNISLQDFWINNDGGAAKGLQIDNDGLLYGTGASAALEQWSVDEDNGPGALNILAENNTGDNIAVRILGNNPDDYYSGGKLVFGDYLSGEYGPYIAESSDEDLEIVLPDGELDINVNEDVNVSAENLSVTAVLNMNSNPIQNVADPTDAQDVATKNYVDTNANSDIGFGTEGQVLTMVGGVATWVDPCVSSLFYADTDSDGYGDNSVFTVACAQPVGYVSNGDDCNDSDANINPVTVWYKDADNDGYGDSSISTTTCSGPSGYVTNADDCNDADAAINPDTVWYLDADSDGYGDDFTSITACVQPNGYVTVGFDCDDSDAAINPGAVDVVGDGIDSDCDGDDAQPTPPTLLSGYADAHTFTDGHSENYSTVNIGSDAQPQILVASTQMTKVIIYPLTTTTGATVIPFLVDADYNVIVVGETYTINTTAGAAYEIVFDSTLSASEPFYFGTYESIGTSHDSNYGNEKYRWQSGTPQLNTTISGTGTNSARSTQGYGF